METLTKNPGFWNPEDIFKCLDKESLLNCRLVNKTWKEILDVPIFCLRNFKSSEIVENWKFLSQQIDDEQIAKKFDLILIKGAFTYYVSTMRGEGGSKISQNMLIYSTKTAYERGEGGQKSLKICLRNM